MANKKPKRERLEDLLESMKTTYKFNVTSIWYYNDELCEAMKKNLLNKYGCYEEQFGGIIISH